MRPLPPPPGAFGNSQAREILAAWHFDEGVSTLFDESWDDPSEWGEVLGYIAKDLAHAFAAKGLSTHQTLWKIREAFEAEIKKP